MPHPVYILLRWIESCLCYLVQFATGLLSIALCYSSTEETVATISAGVTTIGDFVIVVDWLATGLVGAVFLTFGLFERILTRLSSGPGRLVLDIVMAAVMVRGGLFVFHLVLGLTTPFQGRLDHPFFSTVATGWLLMYFVAFLVPGLAYRRLEPLPTLRAAWNDCVRTLDLSYARIAVVGSLLIGPVALLLPLLQLLP